MNNTNQTQRIKAHQNNMMRTITGIFSSCPNEYCRLQFDKGLEYVQMIEPNPNNQQRLSYSSLFWAWWKNNWAIRDWEWIEWQLSKYEITMTGVNDGDIPIQELRLSYLSFHRVRDLAGEIRPPDAVYLKKGINVSNIIH